MKAVLFDLDDTLIDNRHAMRAALEAFLRARGADPAQRAEQVAAWRAIALRHWMRYERGEISFAQQRRERVREFLHASLSDAAADRVLQPYLDAYRRAWRLLPGVIELLQSTRRIPKVIVTNGDRQQQMTKIRALGLDAYVHAVVTPDDCGHWKPHPAIFAAVLREVQAAASDCLMVGDDLARDIEPARHLGMRVFQVGAERGMRELGAVIQQTFD